MDSSILLHEFLKQNKKQILAITEQKIMDLAGNLPSTSDLKSALPIFFERLLKVLALGHTASSKPDENKEEMAKAARENNEPAMANASGRAYEADLAQAAGEHGVELLRLGYSLSHVIHAYGAICQAITELSTEKDCLITTSEFNDLNRCLDVAIAGAVTQYQKQKNFEMKSREIEHLGFLAHELRNTLNSINVSFQLIKKGTVGLTGSTGQIMERSLKRLGDLVDRSLTEVRIQVDPKVMVEEDSLLNIVDQIMITAEVEAKSRDQKVNVEIDPSIVIQVDQQLFYSAVSNLIQNALKYTHNGGMIQIRGNRVKDKVVFEVEDECGGLTDASVDLFKPFQQQNENRKGLGLGLTIAKKAIELNLGILEVKNLPGKGCIFMITMPDHALS